MPPRTQYARSGGIHIAYQVVGDGPLDLVYVPGWVSHVEQAWEEPSLAAGSGVRFMERGVHTLKGVPGEWRLFRAT